MTNTVLNISSRIPVSGWGSVKSLRMTHFVCCYGNRLALSAINPWLHRPFQVEEHCINTHQEMDGSVALQGNASWRFCGINTLANTRKHCINVNNYRQEGVIGGGGKRRGQNVIRIVHWLSITPTDVHEGLSIKHSPVN